jgi:hypothetical protein
MLLAYAAEGISRCPVVYPYVYNGQNKSAISVLDIKDTFILSRIYGCNDFVKYLIDSRT